jgi:hypothetical protein
MRPMITPYSGTNTELSISRKGSSVCIGSTSASAMHSAASSRPQRFTLQRGSRLCVETEPE